MSTMEGQEGEEGAGREGKWGSREEGREEGEGTPKVAGKTTSHQN